MEKINLKTPWFCSRKRSLKFLVDDDPIFFMLRVDRGNDLAIEHPGVSISVYAELVCLVTDSSELPLEGLCECYFLLATENGRTSRTGASR